MRNSDREYWKTGFNVRFKYLNLSLTILLVENERKKSMSKKKCSAFQWTASKKFANQ